MDRLARSPRIDDVAWGSVSVEGRDEPFRDVKLWPGGSREWDWNETGTRHDPGIQPADVAELLEHGATTVVLARGYLGRLKVDDATLSMLRGVGIRVHALPTAAAVALYNELRKTERVGALFHTTC